MPEIARSMIENLFKAFAFKIQEKLFLQKGLAPIGSQI